MSAQARRGMARSATLRLGSALAAAFLLSQWPAPRAVQAQAQKQAPTWRRTPQDIAFFPSGRGVVLYQDGRVYTFDAQTGHLGARHVYELPPAWGALAVIATARGEQEWIHLLVVTRGAGARQTHLLHISARGGDASWNWALSERGPVELVARPGGESALLLTEDGRVYECDLMVKNANARQVGFVASFMRFGSAAWDPRRQRLLVAEAFGDDIHALALTAVRNRSARGEPFTRIRGADVTALVVDAAADRLYVADAGQERIFDIDLSWSPPEPRPLATASAKMRDPISLAIGPDGRLWVADSEARAVFALSAAGERAVTLAPPPP